MTHRGLAFLLLGVFAPLVATTHCGSSHDSGEAVSGTGGVGAVTTGTVVTLPPGGAAGESASGGLLNPLCGGYETYDCLPDTNEGCEGVDLNPESTTSTGGVGGTGGGGNGTGGSDALGGQAGAGGEPAEGGAAGQAGEPGSGGIPIDEGPDVSVGSPDPLEPTGVACRVVAGDEGATRVCAPAGAGLENAPCTSQADCAGTLACVGEGDAGVCRPYCCQLDRDGCATGHYCGERVILGSELSVPVCVPADNCDLAQEYPCPNGRSCDCGEGTACLVVRGDGTTTCAEPGRGEVGEACPCAWGHVCSQASQTCLKLCETVMDNNVPGESPCGEGVCQTASTLPGDWGVCIDTNAGQ